jgi:hypothetical protein
MTESERAVQVTVAESAALVERAAADLAIAEEPAGLLAALEEGADE